MLYFKVEIRSGDRQSTRYVALSGDLSTEHIVSFFAELFWTVDHIEECTLLDTDYERLITIDHPCVLAKFSQ